MFIIPNVITAEMVDFVAQYENSHPSDKRVTEYVSDLNFNIIADGVTEDEFFRVYEKANNNNITYGCDKCGLRLNADLHILWVTSSLGLCPICYSKCSDFELYNFRAAYE